MICRVEIVDGDFLVEKECSKLCVSNKTNSCLCINTKVTATKTTINQSAKSCLYRQLQIYINKRV